jgi:hypothetical protein
MDRPHCLRDKVTESSGCQIDPDQGATIESISSRLLGQNNRAKRSSSGEFREKAFDGRHVATKGKLILINGSQLNGR